MKRGVFRSGLCVLALLLVLLTGTPVRAADTINGLPQKITMTTRSRKSVHVNVALQKVNWTSSNSRMVRIVYLSGVNKKTAWLKTGAKTGVCRVRARIGHNIYNCVVTVIDKQ